MDNSNNSQLASIIPPLPHALVESIRRYSLDVQHTSTRPVILTHVHSARNLVRDVTGEYDSEAETALGQDTPFAKLDVSAVATRLFALLFLVKGIECCATSKVQGEQALAEVLHQPLEFFMHSVFPNACT